MTCARCQRPIVAELPDKHSSKHCQCVEPVPESAQPAERAGEWVSGNGSELPNGTEAWISWQARDGLAVAWSYRREGGWGSDGIEKESLERPAFPDEEAWLGGPPVLFYKLEPKPAPPQPKGKP